MVGAATTGSPCLVFFEPLREGRKEVCKYGIVFRKVQEDALFEVRHDHAPWCLQTSYILSSLPFMKGAYKRDTEGPNPLGSGA